MKTKLSKIIESGIDNGLSYDEIAVKVCFAMLKRQFEFSKWLGENYIYMDGRWAHKLGDQTDERKFKTTGTLWDLFEREMGEI